MQVSQLNIDFTHRRENNSFSESILEANRHQINGNCRKVLNLLLSGIKLTVRSADRDYNITSLPRRILDLERKLNYTIPQRTIDNRFCEWFLNEWDIIRIEELLNKKPA